MAGKSIFCWSLVLLVAVFTRQGIAQDGASWDFVTVMDPADPTGAEADLTTITYTTTATTSITIYVSITQLGVNGVEVTGIGAYFKNDAGSVESDVILNSGSITIAADASTAENVVMPMIVKGEECTEYTTMCFVLQIASGDGNETCILIGTTSGQAGSLECPDVGLTSVTITSPASPTYTEGTAASLTFSAVLTQANGGVASSAIGVYFANDDVSEQTTAVDATGSSSTGSDLAITGAVVSATIDTDCTYYTQLCFDLDVSLDEDTDHSNNQYCMAIPDEDKTCGGIMNQLNILLFVGSLLGAMLMNRK